MAGQATTEAEGVTETNSTKNSQTEADLPTEPGKTESDAVTIATPENAEIGTGAEPKPAEAQEALHGRAANCVRSVPRTELAARHARCEPM